MGKTVKTRKRVYALYYKFMGYLKENNIKLKELSDLLGDITVQTINMENNE